VKIVISEEQIRDGVTRLAREITDYYADRPLTIIGVLTGSIVLMADLIRQLNMPLRVGVVQASSYRGSSTTRGPLVLNSDLMPDIAGRDVLLIDDIYDTGHTLVETIALLDDMRPASIRSAVLLRKRGRQEVTYEPDYVAFEIPNEFVVGYGLDYQDAYRDLPHVAALEASDLDGDPP
jgi:hypoxanthine phosphoribosyltransferase